MGEDVFQLHVVTPNYATRNSSLPAGALQISFFKKIAMATKKKMVVSHKTHKLGRQS